MEEEAYVGRKFRTKFLGKSFALENSIAGEFLAACRTLYAEGMGLKNSGNISVRTPAGMIIKAGGVSLGRMKKEHIVLVASYDSWKNEAKTYGTYEPSSETPMHWLIYMNFPKVNGIIHAHDPLVIEKPAIRKKLNIVETRKDTAYGTIEQANEVINALKKSDYVYIRNHGSVSIGVSLQEALEIILAVHKRFKNEGDC